MGMQVCGVVCGCREVRSVEKEKGIVTKWERKRRDERLYLTIDGGHCWGCHAVTPVTAPKRPRQEYSMFLIGKLLEYLVSGRRTLQ